MKAFNLSRAAILFLIVLPFMSCKKDNNDGKVDGTLSPDEFIFYSVNGTDYNFLMPVDEVLADTLTETTTFYPASRVRANRIPSTTADFVSMSYYRPNTAVGSQQQLVLFGTAQTEIYPYYATSAAPIFISITEYGNVGEYIAGNFSGLITGAAPANLQYNVTCNFRVKRRI